MNESVNPDKILRIWRVIKQIVEIVLAALAGSVTASVAQSCGLI